MTYGLADVIGGNGFLAVYLAGLVLGSRDFLHRRSLTRFHDGIAWIMQIAMFLTLGLLVFPSRLLPVAGIGLMVTAFLMLVGRPASVFATLALSRWTRREKLFLSWVGLRGAVPIVLATYPRLAGLTNADAFFNIVFFVVLASVLLQGTTIPSIARALELERGVERPSAPPLEVSPSSGLKSELHEIVVDAGSLAAGKTVMELGLPSGILIVLVGRDGEQVVPTGATVLRAGDVLLILAESSTPTELSAFVNAPPV